LKACFLGNADYLPACSAIADHEVITLASTTTLLSLTPTSIYPDEPVTATVKVEPAPEVDTVVWVSSDSVSLVTVPIPAGTTTATATMVPSPSAPSGISQVTARFAGTYHLEPSTSAPIEFEVHRDSQQLNIVPSPAPVLQGQPLQVAVTLTPPRDEPDFGLLLSLSGPPGSGQGDSCSVYLDSSGHGSVDVPTGWMAAGEWRFAAGVGPTVRMTAASAGGTFRVIEDTPPTGTIAIDAGAAVTPSAMVGVNLAASDGYTGSGVVAVALSNDGEQWSEFPHQPVVEWTLAPVAGIATVHAKWLDADGNWSTPVTDTIQVDAVAPVVTKPTTAIEAGGATVGSTVPVRVAWSGSDTGSGVTGVDLELSTDAGAYLPLATDLSGSSTVRALAPGHRYRLRARAKDAADNASAWIASFARARSR
jgi:hypothetical protein